MGEEETRCSSRSFPAIARGEVLPMTGIYGEASPGRGIFFIQIYERAGISLVEVYEGKGSHISKTGHLQLLTVVERDAQF